jgi:hypothetical protein
MGIMEIKFRKEIIEFRELFLISINLKMNVLCKI